MSTAVDATDGGFEVISLPLPIRSLTMVRRTIGSGKPVSTRVEVAYPQYIYMKEEMGSLQLTFPALTFLFPLRSKSGITGHAGCSTSWEKEIVEVRELLVLSSKGTGQQLAYVPTLQGRINNNMTL